MANRTVKEAISIKGTNPQYLVEKIIRTRIYDSRFWKEECFALTAELLVDKAIELKSIGGVYGGNVKPTPFICLILKLLQIQPDKDIIVEFIRNKDYKYVRALGAFYMRLTGTSAEIFKYLEPLYSDYRKMKRLNKNAAYELVHMDEFIDELLHGDRVCDVALPRLQKRSVLEELNELEPRVSPLDINLDDIDSSSSSGKEEDSDEEDEEAEEKPREKAKHSRRDDDDKKSKSKYKFVDYDNPDPEDEMPRYRRSPEREERRKHSTKSRRRSRSRSRSKSDDSGHRRHHRHHKDRRRSRSHSRRRSSSRERSESRSRSRSRDRHHERRRRRSRS